jgi:hypothetical protein
MANRRMSLQYGVSGDGEPLIWKNVKVIDGWRKVLLNGSIIDAMSGEPGKSIGCHLSRCAYREKLNFPHPVKAPPIFWKSRAFVVSKIAGGQATEIVKYRHEYGAWVDLNDTDIEKEFFKQHPELAEVQFTLHPPYKHAPSPGSHATGNRTGEKRIVIPRGTMARMAKAGLVGWSVED